jgi:cytochrome P450
VQAEFAECRCASRPADIEPDFVTRSSRSNAALSSGDNVGRRPIEDVTIGGHFIPAGTNVLMSQWVVHRDPRWFDDPLRFDPDRWANGFASRLPKYAYFPFGGGPRVCIGNAFAMFEATLVLALMAQRFSLELVTQGPIRMLPAVTLRPGQPIELRVNKLR